MNQISGAPYAEGEPFFFGTVEQPLFGCYHAPVGAHRHLGVVLCYPFGHEYLRAHRACRQLAIRLARAGFPALRFDYFGCGDSSGEDGAGDLRRWETDIETALAEMKKRSGVTRAALVGLRVGSALALRAGARCGNISHLVLWEPVWNGRAYLDELSVQHQDTLWKFFERPTDLVSNHHPTELLGFAIPDALFADFQKLDLTELQKKPADKVFVIASQMRDGSQALIEMLQKLGSQVGLETMPAPKVWTEDPDKALVPHQTLQAIVAWLTRETG